MAEALRRRGIDVATPADAGLLGAADEAYLDYARDTERIVVTADSDFLRLHRELPHAGIAGIRARSPLSASASWVQAERRIGSEHSVEDRYSLLSRVLDAKTFAAAVLSHWEIENQVHSVLDVSFHED
jgi:Domain of unknown function (DUF5615)